MIGFRYRAHYTKPNNKPIFISKSQYVQRCFNLPWNEFRLWYGDNISKEALYEFRKKIMSRLDELKVDNFLILNEPKFVLLRVQSNMKNDEIEKNLSETIKKSDGAFSKVDVIEWDPKADARGRILGAAQRLGIELKEKQGWKVVGREPLNQHWELTEDDLDKKVEEFSTFMTRVAGKFTKAYIEKMPRPVDDRWLLSVMLHLLLNSIALDSNQEKEAREFTYV